MATEADHIAIIFEVAYENREQLQALIKDLGLVQKEQEKTAKATKAKLFDTSNLNDFRRSWQQMAWSLRSGDVVGAAMGFQDLSQKIGAASKGAVAAKGGLGALMTGMTGVAVAAGGTAAAIAGVALAYKSLVPIAKEGAALYQLQDSFQRLNASMLHTPSLLYDIRNAARGTITTFETMEGFLTLTAGASERNAQAFARAAPKLMEIAKAANVLNPTLGDTNFMFNSLARGIKRSEVRLLDNLGLNIKVADANKRWAQQMGTTVLAMDAEEKQLALLNETLRVGLQLIEQVGGDTKSATDEFMRASTAWAELLANSKVAFFQAFPVGPLEKGADYLEDISERQKASILLADALADGALSQKYHDKLVRGLMENYLDADDVIRSVTAAEERHTAAIKAKQVEIENLTDLEIARMRLYERLPPVMESGVKRHDVLQSTLDNELALKRMLEGRPNKRHGEKWHEEAADELGKRVSERIGVKSEKYRDAVMALNAATRDLTMAVYQHNVAVWEEMQARIAHTGDLMRQFIGDESLYTTSISNIGDAWTYVGGRTKEENEVLEDLRDAYDRANKEVRDITYGIKGFGKEQDDINKMMELAAGKVEHYGNKISELESKQGQAVRTTVAAVWDWEKIDKAIISAAESAGLGADSFAQWMMAVGDWDEDQATAAIKAGALAAKIEETVRAGLSPEKGRQIIQDFANELSNMDISMVLRPKIEWQQEAIAEAGLEDVAASFGAYIPREEREAAKDHLGDVIAAKQTVSDAYDFIMQTLYPAIKDPPEMVITATGIEDIERAINNLPSEHMVTITYQGSYTFPPGYKPEAMGGPVTPGQEYLVGERGPEIFRPNVAGQIIPNHELGGTGGGSVYNITIHDEAGMGLLRATKRRNRLSRVDTRMGI